MVHQNPYQSPAPDDREGLAGPRGDYAPCPYCASVHATKVDHTWWGGFVGPRILRVVKCDDCGASFAGHTGEKVTGKIVLYVAIGLPIGIGFLFALYWLRSLF